MDNVVKLFQERQCLNGHNVEFENAMHVNLSLVQRLGLQHELQGHRGCVNCLQWSDCGELLASGSDDYNVIIWDIIKQKKKTTINTGHDGNIFAVKFLPSSNNNVVASGAADSVLKIHDITSKQIMHNFTCHSRRIKRLAVSKQSPFVIWSSGEDGTVREFDLRTPHNCSSSCKNIIINLIDHVGGSAEVKCIQLHPYFPELIAVGSTDPYVRLYDRRMLTKTNAVKNGTKDSSVNTSGGNGCVSYFAPGHLIYRKNRTVKPRKSKNYTTTYVSFSPDGQELLQNLGGEHIYMYRLNEKCKPLVFSTNHKNHDCSSSQKDNKPIKIATEKNGIHNKSSFSTNRLASTYEMRKSNNFNIRFDSSNESFSNILPEKASKLKLDGNDAFSQHNYFQATVCYNKALRLVPNSSVLYANRGAALLKRGWDGDIYAALRDCQVSVEMDPSHSKAYYRQAKCLFDLNWYEEAEICLHLFKEKFPNQNDAYSVKKLQTEISQRLNQIDQETKARDEDSDEFEATRHRQRDSVNEDERNRRDNAYDYELRFVGSCNTTTDIKEANYFGKNGQFIIAGSDCGCMLMWDRSTTNLIEAWQGDDSIVNCLQPHPTSCLVATSGLDPVVRLWSPRPVDGSTTDIRAKEVEGLARANQKRMNTDPLEEMLRAMGYRPVSGENTDDEDVDDNAVPMQCRTS